MTGRPNPPLLQPLREDGPLNEAQVLTRRVLEALGHDQCLVAQLANVGLDLDAERPGRADAAMAERALEASSVIRTSTQQNRDQLPLLSDRRLQGLEGFRVRSLEAVGMGRRVDQRGVDLDGPHPGR